MGGLAKKKVTKSLENCELFCKVVISRRLRLQEMEPPGRQEPRSLAQGAQPLISVPSRLATEVCVQQSTSQSFQRNSRGLGELYTHIGVKGVIGLSLRDPSGHRCHNAHTSFQPLQKEGKN